MELDDELCICFHVSQRKILNFLRIEKPQRAAQLADCFGAGTGCGWCRPFLRKLFQQAADDGTNEAHLPTATNYAKMRAGYLAKRQDDSSASPDRKP